MNDFSIKKLLLVRGGELEFRNLMNFIRSIDFKFPKDVLENESPNYNPLEFEMYKKAMSGSERFRDYSSLINVDDIESFLGISHSESLDYYFDISKLESIKDNNYKAKNYLNYLINEAKNYKETNAFYKKYMGIPDENNILYVPNLDTDNPIKLNIVTLDYNLYPLTYIKYFVEREIDVVIKNNSDKKYLQFIENPLDIIGLRSIDWYGIINYKKLINENDINLFLNIYDRIRNDLIRTYYFENFEKEYNKYGDYFFLMLITTTLLTYFNEKYSSFLSGNYLNFEIITLLKSYNLNELVELNNFELNNLILKNIDDLILNKGTDDIFEKILLLTNNDPNMIKKILLLKKYNVDGEKEISYSIDHTYLKSIDLVFKEANYFDRSEDAKYIMNFNELDYLDTTLDDDYWGGVKDLTVKDKILVKEEMKRELINISFNSIKTKYISLVKNIIIKNIDDLILTNLVIIFEENRKSSNLFKDNFILFNNYEMNFYDIYLGYVLINKVLDSSTQIYDNNESYELKDILLYKKDNLKIDRNDMKFNVLNLDNKEITYNRFSNFFDNTYIELFGAKKKLRDILLLDSELELSDDEDIKEHIFNNYCVFFDIIDTNDVSKKIEQIDSKLEIIKKIKNMINRQKDSFDINWAWNSILNFNIIEYDYYDDITNYMNTDNILDHLNISNKLLSTYLIYLIQKNQISKLLDFKSDLIYQLELFARQYIDKKCLLKDEDMEFINKETQIKQIKDLLILMKLFISIYLQFKGFDILIEKESNENIYPIFEFNELVVDFGITDTYKVISCFSITDFIRISNIDENDLFLIIDDSLSNLLDIINIEYLDIETHVIDYPNMDIPSNLFVQLTNIHEQTTDIFNFDFLEIKED